MIQTIIFISSIYIASSNRLLLQQQWVPPYIPGQGQPPPQNPGSNPQIPAQINPNPQQWVPPTLPNQQLPIPRFPVQTPEPIEPIVPQQPQVLPYSNYQIVPNQRPQQILPIPIFPVQTIEPIEPIAPNQQPPQQYYNPGRSTPWVPPTIPTIPPNPPAYTPIYNPGLPFDPINNPYGYQPAQPNTTPFPQGTTEVFCGTVNSCSHRQMRLYNAGDTFRWTCEVPGSCNGATLTMAFDHMSASVEMLEGIFCQGGREGLIPGSCEGITFMMNNVQLGGHSIEIEKIECSGDHSCANAQFILGPNVKVHKIYCDYGQCDGCKLKVSPYDVGTDCTTAGLMGEPFPL